MGQPPFDAPRKIEQDIRPGFIHKPNSLQPGGIGDLTQVGDSNVWVAVSKVIGIAVIGVRDDVAATRCRLRGLIEQPMSHRLHNVPVDINAAVVTGTVSTLLTIQCRHSPQVVSSVVFDPAKSFDEVMKATRVQRVFGHHLTINLVARTS